METKRGLIALIVGGYLEAFGLAGINANSGGAVAIFAVVLVLGVVAMGWSMVLPWDGGKAHHAAHDAPGPVPRPRALMSATDIWAAVGVAFVF